MKILYRYDSDLTTEEFTGNLFLSEHEIQKETTCGYWIIVNSKKKFILKGGSGKRYAYESKEGALNRFIKRKIRQIEINKSMLNRAKKELETANKLISK